jgi:hypothetical protein
MFEHEDEEDEIAPSLNIIAKKRINNHTLAPPSIKDDLLMGTGLNNDEIESVFNDVMPERTSRRSKKSTNSTKSAKSTKKSVKSPELKNINTVKKVKGDVKPTKVIKNEIESVNTISSIKPNRKQIIHEVEDIVDDDKVDNELDLEIDEKISKTKERLDDVDVESLKEIIKLYLYVDEKCGKLAEESKDCKAEKKQYENHILEFMGDMQKEKIQYEKSVLCRKVTVNRPKPKEEDIMETLNTVFNDPDVAYEITQKIFNSVPLEEKVALKKEKEKSTQKSTKKTKKTSKKST